MIALLMLLVVVIYFWKSGKKLHFTGKENIYMIDEPLSLRNNPCSLSCCPYQYLPFELDRTELNYADYVPTNIYCSTQYGSSGCMCMTKEQVEELSSRGGNK